MRTGRLLVAGLVLGGILGAGWARRYLRRQRFSALASDPLLGWNGESGAEPARHTALPAPAGSPRGDSMPSPTAPLGAA